MDHKPFGKNVCGEKFGEFGEVQVILEVFC